MTDTIRKIYEETGGDVSKTISSLTDSDVTLTIPINSGRQARRAPEDAGKASLRRFRVSDRHMMTPDWPVEDRKKINLARAAYEAGTHEMFQEKTRCGWYILYLQPRRVPIKRDNPWFYVRRAL